MDLADLLHIRRTRLLIDLKCSVAASDDGLRDGNPRVVVAEDAGIFLVPGRIGGDLTQFNMILCVGRL